MSLLIFPSVWNTRSLLFAPSLILQLLNLIVGWKGIWQIYCLVINSFLFLLNISIDDQALTQYPRFPWWGGHIRVNNSSVSFIALINLHKESKILELDRVLLTASLLQVGLHLLFEVIYILIGFHLSTQLLIFELFKLEILLAFGDLISCIKCLRCKWSRHGC